MPHVQATASEEVTAHQQLKDSPQRWWLVVILHFGMLFNSIHRGSLSAAAPFMMTELGLSTTVMGVLLSAFFWPYSFLQTPAGWAVDRYGVKRVYAIGFAVWSLAAGMTGLARGLVPLAILRGILGAGQAVIFPAHSRAIADCFSERERGTATAFSNSANRLGQAFSNSGGPLLIAAFGWQFFFLTTGFIPLIWLLPWLMFMRKWEDRPAAVPGDSPNLPDNPNHKAAMSLAEGFALLKQRSMLGICLGYFCYNYTWILLITWLPGYLKMERGFTTGEIAVFSSVPYVMGFVVALLAGLASDWFVRRGCRELLVRKTFMTAGMAVACLIVPAGIVTDKMTAVWLLAAALCGLSTSGVSSWLVTQAVCERKITGTGAGLQNFFGNLGGIIAPVLTGFIAHRTGSFALALGLTGGLLICGIAAYWLMVKERVTLEETKQQTP